MMDTGQGDARAIASDAAQDVRRLEAKIEQFERVIRWFVELPAVQSSPSAEPLLRELGYEMVSVQGETLSGRTTFRWQRKAT